MDELKIKEDNDVVFTTENTSHDCNCLNKNTNGYKSKIIKKSHYKKYNIDQIVHECNYLTKSQKQDLNATLNKFSYLFSGKLGKYTKEKIHLEIDKNITPHASRAYPVPKNNMTVFKNELDKLVELEVFEKGDRSQWIAGTFIIPIKDASVRWITDFRALNRALCRKVYPLPIISEVLARRKSYKYVTKLDLLMQYYCFELDDESRELCTFATPF